MNGPMIDPRFEHLTRTTTVAYEEPAVSPREVIAGIPAEMQVAGVWGTVEQQAAYLRHVNGVPEHAPLETEHDATSGTIRLRWSWWEIHALVERPQR